MLPHPSPDDPAARLAGVGVRFGDLPALADVDLELAFGALTVITGPNGAGKSTLLEVIAGVRRPSTGIRTATTGRISFVPQRTQLPDRLPVTVRDVVSVGTWGRVEPRIRRRADARRAVTAAIGRMGLEPLADRPFGELSGGQRQRALLAQGIAGRAQLLLLDEPTTGLDRGSGARIRAVMREEADTGGAVVCVSHDPAVIDVADRHIAVDDGRLVAVSTRSA